MTNKSLDTALRVALIGSLIIVMLCVISFGLTGNRSGLRPQDAPSTDLRQQYVAVPAATAPAIHYVHQPAAPVHHAVHGDVAVSTQLASLERAVDALSGERHDEKLSDRLRDIETRIDRLGDSLSHQSPAPAGPHPGHHMASQLANLESRIDQLGHALGDGRHSPPPSNHQQHSPDQLQGIETRIDRLGELLGKLTQMSATGDAGTQRLNTSVQQLDQSVSGIGGTVAQIDRSVRLLNDQQDTLRKTVEDRQTRTAAQVDSGNQQIHSKVVELVESLNALKTEVAGLRVQPPSRMQVDSASSAQFPTSDASSSEGQFIEASTTQPAPQPEITAPMPMPVEFLPTTEPEPELSVPAVSEEESSVLPLAPREEPEQPEPFPGELPAPSVELLQPEIVPQSASIQPAAPVTEPVERATLEVPTIESPGFDSPAFGDPAPQPATLSPNWSSTPNTNTPLETPAIPLVPAATMEDEEPEPAAEEVDVRKISLPSPISQVSGFRPTSDSEEVISLPVYEIDSISPDETEQTFRFTATVMHVSAESKSVTARPGVVRLQDKGGDASSQAVGHDAMVKKLMRNAARNGAAQIVKTGLIEVTSDASGRLPIGSPCLHCNKANGVDAGDQVVLTWHDGWIQVHGESPERQVRIDSLPVSEFQPQESVTPTTWLISEEAQEGTVGTTSGDQDSQLAFVQRLVILTMVPPRSGESELLPVAGFGDNRVLPAIQFSEPNRDGFGRRSTEPTLLRSLPPAEFSQRSYNPAPLEAPRLLSPAAIRDAVQIPSRSEPRAQVQSIARQTQPTPRLQQTQSTSHREQPQSPARTSPMGLLRSVFNSRKSEATDATETTDTKDTNSRRTSGRGARSWIRR